MTISVRQRGAVGWALLGVLTALVLAGVVALVFATRGVGSRPGPTEPGTPAPPAPPAPPGSGPTNLPGARAEPPAPPALPTGYLRYLPPGTRVVVTINVAALPRDEQAAWDKVGERLY